ncbi:autotransporter assembly complex protein TamA [Jannaschia faecimaris]|nr:autotransporter assembly complex family protein [Jannaschia faecimaris]
MITAAGLALSILVGPVWAAELNMILPRDDGLRDNLRAASLTKTAVDEGETERRNLVAATQADYQRLLAVLFEAGYFSPVITIQVDGVEAASLPAVSAAAPVNQIVITVESGPQFLFRRAEISPVAPGTEIPEAFRSGAIAGTAPIRQAATAGVEGWRAVGHAKADIASQQITADHPAQRLDARLTVEPGPRLQYGPTFVDGSEDVRANHIQRIANLRQGEVFDPEEVRASARRLQRTGAFSSVSITESEQIGPANTLPMTVQVVERLPRRIGFGAEVSTDDGLSTSAFWLHRNLTGYADSLRIEGEVSGVGGSSGGADYGISFAYNRPSTFNPETDLFVNGGIESLDEPNFKTDRVYVEGGARRIVSERFQYSYGVGYEYSKDTDAFGERTFSTLSVPLKATYDRRNDALNPSDGYYIEAGMRPFVGFQDAGSGVAFDADLRGYRAFGNDDRTVLAARLQLGSIVGPDIDEVPSHTLFFSGGGGSVRGQEFQSLGVALPSGELVGGRSFVGLSTEIRQQITQSIGVVGFVDFGLVSPDSTFSGGDTHSGAGLGVRYNTGIGPIRFDIGVPLSGPGDPSGVEIYIGIGQAF